MFSKSQMHKASAILEKFRCTVLRPLVVVTLVVTGSSFSYYTLHTAASASEVIKESNFKFFWSLISNAENDPQLYGFDEVMPIAYAGELWPRHADRTEPDRHHIIAHLRNRYEQEAPARLVLDVEHWPVGIHVPHDEREESIRKYITVANAAKEALPNTEVGFYSVLPVREYWAPVTESRRRLSAWRAANRQLRKLADHVDFVAPSIYTFYKNYGDWERYAGANISAAREYGKPVYPFIWPLYHQSNFWRGKALIEREFFTLQMKTVRRMADGAIVWNDHTELPKDWFKETQETIESLK